MKEERRIIGSEIRAVEKDGKHSLEGYAAKFNTLSLDLGGFFEKVDRGAFGNSLKNATDVRALHNHDPNLILGRVSAKTLELSEDDVGLKVKIMPPETQWAKDLMVSIQRGDISQMSFGFRVQKDAWEVNETKDNIRTLMDVHLMDVSSVTFPAYTQSEIYVRSFDQLGLNFAEIQRIMVRFEHNLAISNEDREAILKTVEILNTMAADEIIQDADEEKQKASRLAQLLIIQKQLNLRDRLGG
ncbi:MAG: HK97 family phage prohead protease [Pseudomonadota bacterium]